MKLAPYLEAQNISKTYGSSRVLNNVNLGVNCREVVALLGRNGSGKSTFVNIIAGVISPDSGSQLHLDNKKVDFSILNTARRDLGLGFVFQDLALAQELTVLENLLAFRRGLNGRHIISRIAWSSERQLAREILDKYEVDVNLNARMNDLSATEQALVAIIRAVEEMHRARNGDIETGVLFLDEPTVFLPAKEKKFLFQLIRNLREIGLGIVFISHDLAAVEEIADRVIILEDGNVKREFSSKSATKKVILQALSGHDVTEEEDDHSNELYNHKDKDKERNIELRQKAKDINRVMFSIESDRRLRNVNVSIEAGEVVGIAGLLGSGAEDIPYALFGMLSGINGYIAVKGIRYDLRWMNPSRAIELGMSLIPSDRARDGIAPALTVEEHIRSLILEKYRKAGLIRYRKLRDYCRTIIDQYDVLPSNPEMSISLLSGGNQQKVVMARWMQLHPSVILLHEPSQGVDVITREKLYSIINMAREGGSSILLVSTDFEEMARMCDHVLVCDTGTVVGEVRDRPLSDAAINYAVYGSQEWGGNGPRH